MPALDSNLTNIIGIAALIGALAFLARTAIAILRMASKIDELLPVMMTIAKEFKSNGGSTLLDRVVKLEVHMFAQDKKLIDISEQLDRARLVAGGVK